MTIIHGFELQSEREVPELRLTAKLYRHVGTGTELLSIENDDDNKTFGITFRTPPTDSTGVPHIMEHSVLCGSRKYPVKEPFVELLKSSLQTFLNAMTFADKTAYPVASQNLQDFYNLVDVYLDAVFYPRITPEVFAQEGWHYELNSPDEPLSFKGVVYNEMKGAYSSPDGLIGRYTEQALFPDNAYNFESGGDPRVIPSLTYEQFKDFHTRYYHPSNARIFFYGDDDPEERLRLINEYLRNFAALQVSSAIPLQPPRTEPWRQTDVYPAGEDAENQKSMVTVSWLLPENNDPTLTFSLQMLGYILLGTPASPLRKALIDSGLGEDVIGAGMDDSLRQLYFSAGLKGVAPSDVDKVEQLILSTLEGLARDGIDPDMVEAALNTIEFGLREQNYGSMPRGLVLMIAALTTWLHDGDPIAPLAFEASLTEIKTQLAREGSRYFEDLIAAHLLQNSHRLTFALEPDTELQQKQEAAERARLEEVRASLDEQGLQATIEQTRELKRLQEAPDSPEALATIPRLSLADLDRDTKVVPTALSAAHGAEIVYHDLFSNGIVYLDIGFDLHTLPQELLPYVPLFSDALLEIGTEREDFVKLTQRIGRKTGGIYTTSYASSVRGEQQAATWLFMRAKATMDQTDDLLDILRDVLLTVKLDNQERFLQMLLETKAGMEAGLIPGGHRVALNRLNAKFSEAGWVSEQMSGLSQLFFLRKLVEQARQDWPTVLAHLEEIRHALITRSGAVANVTLDADNWARFWPKLEGFLAGLPERANHRVVWSPERITGSEGLTMPAQVNYVAKGANLYDLGYELDGSYAVITQYMQTTWLWERIRVQGGAYGAFCPFDQHSGVFAFASYRDPNLLATLDNYDQTSRFLREVEISEDELTKSIIGAIGNIDTYQLPDAKGYSALRRHLIGYTDEERQKLRDEVLSTSETDFRTMGEVLAQLDEGARVVVLGSPEAIQAANAQRGGFLEVSKVI
ncbi:MAG: peptidase M16 [Anaerolineales bacterium]|nr:peptidase M16 [Anaerolineales bacterium]